MNRSALIVIAFAAIVAIFLRLSGIPTLNFSALGGLAVLCGAAMPRRPFAILVVLAVRLLTDAVLEARTGYGWYESMAWDYGAYALMVALGAWLRPKHLLSGVTTGLVAALTFFVVSNFGVWISSHGGDPVASRDAAGLLRCYELGLPFLGRSIVSDMLFSGVFIAAWQWMRQPTSAAAAVPASVGSDAG
jgi:hypothetical protein